MVWWFPESWGYPQSSSNFRGIFHNKNHPAIGVSPFMETLIYIIYIYVYSIHVYIVETVEI